MLSLVLPRHPAVTFALRSRRAVIRVRSVFWDDLAGDLEDPDFLRGYITESVRIATVDAVIKALDEARTSEGLTKAELARAIGAEPATVRRLFAAACLAEVVIFRSEESVPLRGM